MGPAPFGTITKIESFDELVLATIHASPPARAVTWPFDPTLTTLGERET
jgi:hypothetical protein